MMTDLAKRQTPLGQEFRIRSETQGLDEGDATLTVQPDEQTVLGPAGSQLVFTFQNGRFVSLEILVATG